MSCHPLNRIFTIKFGHAQANTEIAFAAHQYSVAATISSKILYRIHNQNCA